MKFAIAFPLVGLMTAGVVLSHPTSVNATGARQWRIELVSSWGICGHGTTFATGSIVLEDAMPTKAKFHFRGGIKASVKLPLDGRKRIAAHFRDDDGEGFEIYGALVEPLEQGEWKSGSMSCGGEWRAERIES
jgi:hypothetical protein